MKKIYFFVSLFFVLFVFSTTAFSAVTYCSPSVFGYSTATGGSGAPVLVSSVDGLKKALNKANNKVIIITANLTFSSMVTVQDGSNVTLLGMPGVTLTSEQQTASTSGILFFKRFSNLIIRNLTFVGPGAYDCDGNDLLCFENVINAWVDHCDFQDGVDGNFDNKHNTDNITVSWCRFRYLKAPKPGGSGGSDDHRYTNLLGASSSDKPSDGTYNLTWAYCWWDNGCKERMVRCRNAELHFLNCYWNSSVANYYVGPENAKCYFEGCTFDGKANTKDKIFKSYGGTNACKFEDCSGNLPSNSGTVSKPTYSYTASGREEAKDAIISSCGAGATLTVTKAGEVSSTCDGGSALPTIYTVTWDASTNGGACITASSVYESGDEIGTLPVATKSGYTFDGWFTSASGGTAISASTTVLADITYYAQFTEESGGGGGCETLAQGTQNASHTAIDATVGTITNSGASASDNYVKLGTSGYFLVTAKTGYTPISIGDKLTITVYNKKSSAADRGFMLHTNSSTPHTSSIPASSEGTVTYSLAAGDIESDGTIKIYRSSADDRYGAILLERCSGSTPPPAPNFVLSYDENGGTGTMEDQEQTGASVTVATNGFTAPTGYKFHEWNDNRNGNGTDYDADEVITLTADFTLYAIWEPLSYTITFDKASGFGGADNVSATFDEPMPSIAIPSRTGYTFLGYFTGTNGTGTQYYDGNGNSTNSWTTAGTATLHAAWQSGGITPPTECALHYWFFNPSDATTEKPNDNTVFSSMVVSSSSLNGSITVDGISSSVTGRTGDTNIFGYFTIPDGKTGIFYGLAVSSGAGDRQINLESSSYTSELSVPGGSSSYQRLESEVLPAGTYAITRDGTSKVRMGVVIVKICEAPPTAKKVYLKPGTNWMKQKSGVNPRFAVYYWKSTNPSDIGWLDMNLEDDCGPAYSVEIPNEYDKCIFCRMAGDKLVNDWSNKWNQTSDLDVPTGNAIFFTVPDGAGDNSGSWSETPLQCCVDGTWLRFAGETIMLTAKCVGARKFQWYKDGVAIPEATSTTYTKAAAIGDGGNYTCKAWLVVGQEATSNTFGVRVPFIEIQTPPAPTEPHNGDYVAMPLIRASEEAETASCSLYRGVAWDYAYSVTDGLGYHGNTGTMTSDNCTNWTMNSSDWCRMQTTKEGTYTFEVKFSNSAFTNYTVSLVYPPMKQTAGRPIYIENTATMGWNPDAIYYRIGKGQYGNGDDRNWTAAQRMTLVPGTARYFKTTTPDWDNDFWAWHICNNRGDINQLESDVWGGVKYSIYRTKVVSGNEANEIKQSSNFSGDEIPDGGWTIYLAAEGENGKIGDYNNNCEFHDYTHTPGMLTHKVTITAPEHGTLTVNYVDVENNPQAFGSGDRDLAHTCIITVTAVPECGYAEPTNIFINGSAYGNRDPFTLTEDIIVSASFDVATYSITYNLDGGTINSGEVTEYTFGVGATLPTDVTKSGKEFEGWYDNEACSGTPITSITTTDCGNKTYWANWITCPAVNSGVTLYKFEVKSSMTSGNVCAAANTDYPMTTSNSLSELIGGTLTARVSNTNRLLYASGAFTYKNGDGGVLRVDLDCPIASGDIIRFINSATNNTYNAYVRHTSSTTFTDQIVLAEKNPTITSIAIPDAFIGETTLYIVRGANNGALISYFEIVRSCAVLLDANTNGGKVGGEDTKTVRGAIGEEVALPHAFKDGEKFKGWYDAPIGGVAVSNPYTISAATTLYAQYEDCPDEGTLYKFEVATGLTNGSVTANDVDFEFTTANYLTALIGGTLMTGGSKASKVNIKGNNALNITDNAAYLKIDLDCEIQDGDVFKSTISSNTVYVTNATTRTKTVELPKGTLVQTPIPETLIGEKTLYIWKGDGDGNALSYFEITRPYSVTYKPNGATGSDVVRKGGVIVENMFTREDYNFIAWNTVPDGSGDTYYPGDEVSGPITLYAQWEEIIRSIVNLDATGAYNHYTKSVVATYNLPMPEIATLPQRVGYVFEGYYDEPNGAGTQYYTGLGTSMQNWDKTTSPETLYANWTLPCDLDPTLKNIMPVVTMWDGKKIDEGIVKIICDFDTMGIEYSLLDFVPSEPLSGDLHFEYFDEQIHLIGTSDYNNSTVKTITVTFTIANNCEPQHTYSITSTIRIYPKDQKAKIAFIVTGTKGGAFNEYSADDAAACNDLVTYLRTYFDVTFVNGYATKDKAALATYYAEYDLLIVTDYLNTKEGYTNAIGTLIDKKPILSFEAYVANQSNWHISSNPRDPSPKVQDMKVLCAGHAIFKDAKYNPSDVTETEVVRADTTVQVLYALSTEEEAKGLQGFTINEAPDFIFLATVKDEANNRDLIVCCERQVVFPARLLIYGINFYEMGNLSNAGKIIMRQMIDYLLMTDETKVADCSLVFDNGAGNGDFDPATYKGTGTKGDHKWSTAANWAPGYNIIPTPYIGARIIAECHVNVDDAHAGNVRINKGKDEHGDPVEGKLIIKPYGGLTVAAVVQQVNDTRYASPVNIKAEDLLIESNETGNGAFVYGNKESDVRATVQYYSRAEGAKTSTPVWQYMGTPFQAGQTAIGMYREAWMCRWSNSSDGALGGLWQWVDNEDLILPFEGYCITQEEKKTYTFAGKLNAPVTTTLFLDNRDDDGYAFAANSWTAPIKIQEMKDEDFVNAERTIYIYHTGTYAEWEINGTPVSAKDGAVATLPGQYAVVPIHSSPYILGADSVIPAMQGFFVKTDPSKEASLKLVYNRVVYDAKYFKTSTQPMRAPGRAAAAESEPDVMRLLVAGESYGGDQVHILSRGDFSEQFEDGWDGRKIDGDEAAPKLAVVKEEGEMAVAAVGELEGRELSFRAGKDSQYTFHFDYEGERIYLYDKITHAATEIQTGNTYTFEAGNQTPINRFLITKNPPKVPTDIPAVDQEMTAQPQKYIDHGQLFILYHGRVYDMTGKRVAPQTGKEETR